MYAGNPADEQREKGNKSGVGMKVRKFCTSHLGYLFDMGSSLHYAPQSSIGTYNWQSWSPCRDAIGYFEI